jgi:hypothetical protein
MTWDSPAFVLNPTAEGREAVKAAMAAITTYVASS